MADTRSKVTRTASSSEIRLLMLLVDGNSELLPLISDIFLFFIFDDELGKCSAGDLK